MRLFLLLCLILFGFNLSNDLDSNLKVRVQPDSKIVIHGKSNINRFSCTYSKSLEQDFNLKMNTHLNKVSLYGAKMSISSDGFDCKHRMISRDLKTTIKSDKYNHINIEVKNIYYKHKDTIANVEIELSGVKKTYDIPITITDKKVSGLLKINIKDFKLEAPNKILGIVVLDNNIEIELILNYNLVD